MQIVFVILILIVAVLLTLIVLAQNSKGGGIASNVGISNQVLGVQRSTENVEKITWVLVSLMAFLCIISSFAFNQKKVDDSGAQGGYEPLKTQYDLPNNPQDPMQNNTTPNQAPPTK